MNNKNIIVCIVGFLIIGTGIYFVKNQNSSSTTSTESETYSAPALAPAPTVTPDQSLAPTPATATNPAPVAPASAPTPEQALTPAPTPASTLTPEPISEPEQATASITHNLIIQNFAFNQSSLTVKKGDTVVWTNKDSAPHTVTFDNGGPSSETLNQNQTYRFTFQDAGSFSYICNFHPSMAGTVTVTN